MGVAPIYRCLDFCYSKVNESVCTSYEYMAGLIIELIGIYMYIYSPVRNYTLDTIEVIMTTVTIMIV